VVPKGQGLARALTLASFIAGLPQEAIRTDKESVLRGCTEPLREALRIEAECFNRLIGSAEMREGLRRFAERDHPDRRRGEEPVTPGLVRDK
jgi:enoyl-CoA hydratase